MAVTTAGICNSERSTGPHGPASARTLRPPTDTELYPCPWVSAPGLVPYIFGAPNLGRSAVTHCLEDGCF